MTITATDRRKTYQGNGAATTFTGPRAFAASHLQVFVGTDPVYALVPASQYAVQGLGTAATQVVFNTAPADDTDILILRTVPYDQPTDVTNQGAFLPEIHEDAFDYRVMQIQQLQDGSLQMVLDPGGSGEFVWDAKGMRIVRVGDAVADTDALNYRSALVLVEQVQAGGGSVGITPKFWSWEGDGEVTDFELAGADVFDPLFYDTAMEATAGAGDYLVTKPSDFQILEGVEGSAPVIRFATPPSDGVRGFTTLRGYARPWIGQTPIYTVAPEVVSEGGGATIDAARHNTLILVNSPTPVTLTIRANTGASNDWAAGQFFSVLQVGAGQVTLAIEGGAGELTVPTDFAASTRGVGSIISATCTAPDANAWVAAGDLLRATYSPDLQCIQIADRSVLGGTNITTGAGKASIILPYGIKLRSIAEGGCYASLAVAQAAGNVVTIDVNRNGVSIFSTPLTFDNAEKTTRLAATPAVYADGGDVLYEGDEITIDVDQIGTALAKGLTVYLVGERIS